MKRITIISSLLAALFLSFSCGGNPSPDGEAGRRLVLRDEYETNPELTVTQVNSIICRNAKKLPNVIFNKTKPDGSWNNEYGYGLVVAYSSLLDTPEIVYIQNDTITGTQTIPVPSVISAEKIYVGRDVNDREEQGNVILGQGDITLRAKTVIIKNSTTVPLGTKLKIVNQ